MTKIKMPRKPDINGLANELETLPSVIVDNVDWRFSWEYPGFFVFNSPIGTFHCTPFFNANNSIVIQVGDQDNNEIEMTSDEIPYPSVGSASQFIELITPALTEATIKLKRCL